MQFLTLTVTAKQDNTLLCKIPVYCWDYTFYHVLPIFLQDDPYTSTGRSIRKQASPDWWESQDWLSTALSTTYHDICVYVRIYLSSTPRQWLQHLKTLFHSAASQSHSQCVLNPHPTDTDSYEMFLCLVAITMTSGGEGEDGTKRVWRQLKGRSVTNLHVHTCIIRTCIYTHVHVRMYNLYIHCNNT